MAKHPCEDGLTKDCFRAYPGWAKKVFAYRLVTLLAPKNITKLLPTVIGDKLSELDPGLAPSLLITPGGKIPTEVTLPVDRGNVLPPTYLGVFDPGRVGKIITSPKEEISISIEAIGHGVIFTDFKATWALAHDALIGDSVVIWDTDDQVLFLVEQWAIFYRIFRGILRFSLSEVPAGAQIVSGDIKVFSTFGDAVGGSVQIAPGCGWLEFGDFDSFSGLSIDNISWVVGENVFNLNTDSLSYIQDNIGGFCYFCFRELGHDYNNVAPDIGGYFRVDIHNQIYTDPNLRPKISLKYTL